MNKYLDLGLRKWFFEQLESILSEILKISASNLIFKGFESYHSNYQLNMMNCAYNLSAIFLKPQPKSINNLD